MATRVAEQEVQFECMGECTSDYDGIFWNVDGRFNADGEFEPNDWEETECSGCGIPGEPRDEDILLAEPAR